MRCKIILFLVCCFFAIGCSQGDPVFRDTMGNPVQLTQMKNKWVIVNYWASWCHACVKEIPELNHFYQQYQNKNVMVYGVNYDQLPAENLKQEVKKMDIAFPVLQDDPNPAWRLGEIDVLPTTFIINPQGNVVKILVGPNTEASLLAALNAEGANIS